MLDYIYRLTRNFEKAHSFKPNLLHLNQQHCEHLKLSFSTDLSLQQIINILGMEVIIDQDVIHPKVSWSHFLSSAAS